MRKSFCFIVSTAFALLFFSCASAPTADEIVPADSSAQEDSSLGDLPNLESAPSDGTALIAQPESSPQALTGASGGVRDDKSGVPDSDEVAVAAADLSPDEASRLFGSSKSGGIGVTASWDESSGGDADGGSSLDAISTTGEEDSAVVVSPRDMHMKESGADTIEMRVDVLSGDAPVREPHASETEPVPLENDFGLGHDVVSSNDTKNNDTENTEPDAEALVADAQLPSSVDDSSSQNTALVDVGAKQPAPVERMEVVYDSDVTPSSAQLATEGSMNKDSESDGVVPSDELQEEVSVETFPVSDPVEAVVSPVTEPVLDGVGEEQQPSLALDSQADGAAVSVPVNPSRSVTVGSRQYLDVVYPGSGWVYLGEVSADGSPKQPVLFTYFGRRRNSLGTTFTLRSNSTGNTLLHFYKQDVLTATFIDDYIAVTVDDIAARSGTRVAAPAYAEIVPPYQDSTPEPNLFEQASVEEKPKVEDVATGTKDDTLSRKEETPVPAQSSTMPLSLENDAENRTSDTVAVQSDSTEVSAPPLFVTKETEAVPPVQSPSEAILPSVAEDERTATQNIVAIPSELDAANQQAGVSPPSDMAAIEGDVLEDSELSPLPSDVVSPVLESLNSPGEELLAQAQEAFYDEDYKLAADLLDQFFQVSDTQLDAGLYLKGQVYEAKSDIQNIRTALASYKQVVRQFPQSPFWQRAKNRETYLNRFYFDIR